MAQTSRRKILFGGSAALAAACTSTHGLSKQPGRPNILWLVSEDNNPLIGAYGDRLAHTPTIDALAQEGVLFRNVYSTAPVCAPSRFSIITGVAAEACAPANHMRAVAKLPGFIRGFPAWLREQGYYCTNNAKTDYNCDIDPAAIWDDSGRAAHWRNRDADQPFFAVFNYETTHESRLFEPITGRVKAADVRIPAYLPDTPAMREDFAAYYNLIERMDGELAARLAELRADGLLDNTIVFYYSDNGGVLPRSKRYCYEEGLRCALVVRVPEAFAGLAPPPGSEIETPVSFIDLAPTVLALAGVSKPAHMHGQALLGDGAMRGRNFVFGMRNRMDERYDFVRTVTDGRYRYIRNYMPHRPWGVHVSFAWLAKGYQAWDRLNRAGALTPTQARFFGEKPFEELYDLAADRDETTNLADDPALRDRLAAMRAALDAHMIAINDNGFIPEGAEEEADVYGRTSSPYPLRTLMELAARAARREPAELARLTAALNEANPLVRHWAAQGLLMLGPGAAPARSRLAEIMREDALMQNRIVAAEAVARLGDAGEAVAFLATQLVAGASAALRLQAVNALTFIGDHARPALPAIEQAERDQKGYVQTASRYLMHVLRGDFDPSLPIFDLSSLRPAG